MDDATLQTVYRSVIIAKLTNASSAWYGANSPVPQIDKDSTHLSDEVAPSPPNLPSLVDLCRASDGKLFNSVNNKV